MGPKELSKPCMQEIVIFRDKSYQKLANAAANVLVLGYVDHCSIKTNELGEHRLRSHDSTNNIYLICLSLSQTQSSSHGKYRDYMG